MTTARWRRKAPTKSYVSSTGAVKSGKPDFHTPMGSVFRFLRNDVSQFPREAFLKADPERVADYRRQLEAIGPGPYVGICTAFDENGCEAREVLQRAGYLGSDPQDAGRYVHQRAVRQIVAAELATRLPTSHGVDVHVIDRLDLKNDIDGAAALSSALDLVISAPTAAAATSGSVGTETWFLTAGRTWPQLGTEEFPWYAKKPCAVPGRVRRLGKGSCRKPPRRWPAL